MPALIIIIIIIIETLQFPEHNFKILCLKKHLGLKHEDKGAGLDFFSFFYQSTY